MPMTLMCAVAYTKEYLISALGLGLHCSTAFPAAAATPDVGDRTAAGRGGVVKDCATMSSCGQCTCGDAMLGCSRAAGGGCGCSGAAGAQHVAVGGSPAVDATAGSCADCSQGRSVAAASSPMLEPSAQQVLIYKTLQDISSCYDI